MKKFALRVVALILILATLIIPLASCAKAVKNTLETTEQSSFVTSSENDQGGSLPKDGCALGRHSWELLNTMQEADCEHDGILMYACDCGEFYLQLQKTNGHSFGEWQTYTDATCYDMGEVVRSCESCYHTESKPLAKCEHAYTVSDGNDGQKIYECSVCYDSFTVDSSLVSDTFSSESHHLLDRAEDFSFIILSQGEEYEIRNNLRIIDQYYEGSDEEFSELANVEYTLTKLSDGVWKVAPEGKFVSGTTYKAIRSGDVVFQDYGVQNLTFSIEKEETNVVEFQNGIVFLQALQNASGGYYPYRTDYSNNSGLCYLTLQKVDGLHVGDVLCVGPATSANDIIGNSSKNIFGKIKQITRIDQTDEYLVQLTKPSASELFEVVDIYSSKVSVLENVTVNDSALDQLSASLYASEDFAKLLSATYTTALEHLAAKGLSTKLTSFKEFLEKLDVRCDPFEYVEATSEIKAEISLKGEATLPVTLTSDKNSENLGNVTLSFSSYVTLIFTPFVHFENTKNFDFHITQELFAGLTFHVETNVEYTATSKPYVLNTDSNVYHYKNCKHVAQIKDTSKIQRISTAELLQKVSDKNVATIECGSCQPIQTMLATMYVIHPASGVFHVASCHSAKAIENPIFTERSAETLISEEYSPCGNCHPESVEHNGFEEKLLQKIASEDFGAQIDEIKDFADGLKSHTDGVAKPLLYATFSVYGIATVDVSLGIYLDFQLEATLNYELEFQKSTFYGVRRTKVAGLQTYGSGVFGGEGDFTKNHLTIVGKTRVDVGITSQITLSLLGNRAFAVASADLDLRTGLYAKLHGALQMDFVTPNENYAAGYFEAGLHCTVTISAEVFEFDILKPTDLYKDDFPFLTLGYAKVYYNFVEIPDEVILTKKQTDIAQKGLLNVKYYDLKEMISGETTLSSTRKSSHYRVDLFLGKGEFCYIENGKIVIRDDAEDFTDTLTVRVVGLDTWSEGDPNACLVSLPEYTVTIRYERSDGTEGLAYTLLDDGTYEVSVGTATDVAEIVIPAVYEDILVTRIAENGFEYCSSLINITIGKNVKIIGNYAFHYCPNLTSLKISDSVTNIGHYAFSDCDSLTSITIPDNVTSIGHGTFYDCFRLTSVKIGNGVTSIGNDAFYDCYSLTSVTLGNHVTSIGSKTFYDCDNLTSITIPASVTSIDSDAFCNCNNLASITLPDSITSIGVRAFDNTAYYNNENNWENGVLYIGNHLIKAKDTISGAYTMKSGTKTIADGSFRLCCSLTSITIPNSVTSIGSSAFSWCNSLANITIPNSVTSIDSSAFSGCSSLTSITIPDGVTNIGYKTFSDCSSLTSITIPNSITSIGGEAFFGCNSLTSIIIPDSVTSIDYAAFYNCSSLTSITLPDSVTNIGYSAFNNTAYYNDQNNWQNGVLYIGNHLIEAKDTISGAYTVKDGTKTIAPYAFYYRHITSITMPNSLTSIGSYAFEGCSSLTSVTIGSGVMSINQWAFYACNNLTSVHITDLAAWCAIDFQNEYANPLCFAKKLYLNETLVTDLVVPKGIANIGSYAFDDCDSLTSIALPDSVTSLGDRAFSWCSSLMSVTIGKGVTSIGEYTFYGCDSLTDIYFEGTEAEWAAIENVESAGFPSSVTIYYNYDPSDS